MTSALIPPQRISTTVIANKVSVVLLLICDLVYYQLVAITIDLLNSKKLLEDLHFNT